jgi:hypothetical protein
MDYDEIEHLRSNHPAWSLLRSTNAPLVLSFLGRVFVERNAGDLSGAELAGELDDELYALNQRLGEVRFPRSAVEYLDEWAAPDRGWLRKFYPPGSDEARYDLSPAVEKALSWVADLRVREFIGTESRLNTIFELLRQMVFGAEEDPERRLTDLRRRRQGLDAEIARAERGEIVLSDPVSQRDRYQQFSRTARELLSDFRQVEENFRKLDRSLRAQIAGWSGSKGALLDDALGSRNSISESDQGRSFQAFYDFLLSQQRQAELSDLLERLRSIQEIDDQDERLSHVHFDWIDACERTQTTVRMLSEQLRRFLDDQVWLENRRVFDLLRSIESKALALREVRQPALTMHLDDTAAGIALPMERPLHRPQRDVAIEATDVAAGSEDFDSDALVTQMQIDRARLAATVWDRLGPQDQIGLGRVLESQPLQQGLAELVGYLSLSEPGLTVVFDPERNERVSWSADEETLERVAELPRVSFARDQRRETP